MAIVEIFKFPTPVSDSVARAVLLHKAASEGDVFGDAAQFNTQLLARQPFDSVIDHKRQDYDWGLSIILLVMLALLYYVGTRFFRELVLAVKHSVSLEKCVGLLNNRSIDYARLIRYSVLLMALGWVAAAFYYLHYFWVDVSDPWWVVYFGTLGVFCGIWAYQAVLTVLCKWVGGWSSFYSVLAYVGQFTAIMFAFVALPIMLLMMLIGLHPWWPFSVIILLYVFHFMRVSKHFITNGFAPLQCFLYLCTVEILPFSAIWLLNR